MIKVYAMLIMGIILVVVFIALSLFGCATIKYFNDSEKIYTDKAKTGVCSGVDFDCVVMSQGKYREILEVNP